MLRTRSTCRLLAVGVAAVLVLTGCGASAGATAAPGPQVGNLAPSLSGSTLEGTRVSLQAWRGTPVVIVFWASWCGPCRDEQATLNDVARGAGSGVHFIGVAVHDEAGAARSFVRDLGVQYDSILDRDEALVGAYLIAGPPTTFVVDRAGRISARLSGPVGGDELRALLRTAAS